MHQDKNRISNETEHLFKAPQAGLLPIRIFYLKPDFTADITSTGQMANAIPKIKEPLWEVISSTFLKHSSHEKFQASARKLFREVSYYSFLP